MIDISTNIRGSNNRVSSNNRSPTDCKYECTNRGGCRAKYIGPSRAGQTSGSCFPDSFGGSCSGTPPECQDCNQKVSCSKNGIEQIKSEGDSNKEVVIPQASLSEKSIAPPSTPSTTVATSRECVDESWCKDANLDESTCQTLPDIFSACYATCTGCNKCEDKKICNTLTLNSIVCKFSAQAKENCPKTCQSCKDKNIGGIGAEAKEKYQKAVNSYCEEPEGPHRRKTWYTEELAKEACSKNNSCSGFYYDCNGYGGYGKEYYLCSFKDAFIYSKCSSTLHSKAHPIDKFVGVWKDTTNGDVSECYRYSTTILHCENKSDDPEIEISSFYMLWDGKINFWAEFPVQENEDSEIIWVDIGTVGTYDGDNAINWTPDKYGYNPDGFKVTKQSGSSGRPSRIEFTNG